MFNAKKGKKMHVQCIIISCLPTSLHTQCISCKPTSSHRDNALKACVISCSSILPQEPSHSVTFCLWCCATFLIPTFKPRSGKIMCSAQPLDTLCHFVLRCATCCTHVVSHCATLYYIVLACTMLGHVSVTLWLQFCQVCDNRVRLAESFIQSEAYINVTEHSMNATERTISVAQRSRANRT